MWKRKAEMTNHLDTDIRIVFPKSGLKVIFDECDRFDHDETGGRLVGQYAEHNGVLTITVTGVIESGPEAKRSPVSFFQDGVHQEQVFRRLETRYPELEHLGTWHTHHVNGLNTLSGGDIDTYHRTANHKNQNTPFFYALLVTTRHKSADPLHRYCIKHFVFRRNDPRFYEIASSHVELIDSPLIWPSPELEIGQAHYAPAASPAPRIDRAHDNNLIREFYPDLQPYSSKIGIYWRGSVELIDGSKIQVVVLEDPTTAKHSVAFKNPTDILKAVADELAERDFSSAREALIAVERICGRVLYRLTRPTETIL